MRPDFKEQLKEFTEAIEEEKQKEERMEETREIERIKKQKGGKGEVGTRKITTQLCEAINDARVNLGLSQDELAQKVGVHRVAIYQIESGKSKTYNPTVQKIVEHLKIDAEPMLGGAYSKPKWGETKRDGYTSRRLIPKKFGAKVKACRLAKGLKQSEFGKPIGMKQAFISQIELGTRKFIDKRVKELAEYCGISLVKSRLVRTGPMGKEVIREKLITGKARTTVSANGNLDHIIDSIKAFGLIRYEEGRSEALEKIKASLGED